MRGAYTGKISVFPLSSLRLHSGRTRGAEARIRFTRILMPDATGSSFRTRGRRGVIRILDVDGRYLRPPPFPATANLALRARIHLSASVLCDFRAVGGVSQPAPFPSSSRPADLHFGPIRYVSRVFQQRSCIALPDRRARLNMRSGKKKDRGARCYRPARMAAVRLTQFRAMAPRVAYIYGCACACCHVSGSLGERVVADSVSSK